MYVIHHLTKLYLESLYWRTYLKKVGELLAASFPTASPEYTLRTTDT